AHAASHRCPLTVVLVPRPPPARSPLFPYTTLFRSRPREAAPGTLRREAGRTGPAPPAARRRGPRPAAGSRARSRPGRATARAPRSEEHTSELQSHLNLVCRLLLEKKKRTHKTPHCC